MKNPMTIIIDFAVTALQRGVTTSPNNDAACDGVTLLRSCDARARVNLPASSCASRVTASRNKRNTVTSHAQLTLRRYVRARGRNKSFFTSQKKESKTISIQTKVPPIGTSGFIVDRGDSSPSQTPVTELYKSELYCELKVFK